MQQFGNSFSILPHLDFQGSQKNSWRAPTLNKAISDLNGGKKKKFNLIQATGKNSNYILF